MKKLSKIILSLSIAVVLFLPSTVFASSKLIDTNIRNTNIPVDKVWKINLNQKIDPNTLQNVYLIDNRVDKLVSTNLSLTNNDETIVLKPKENYDYGAEYTINVQGLKNYNDTKTINGFFTFNTASKDINLSLDGYTAPDVNLNNDEYAYDVTKELSSDKYQGRLSGTEGYTESACYVANVFKSLGLEPQGDSNSYLEYYPTTVAYYTSIPTLKINGQSLTFFKDFKPHGDTDAINVTSDKVVFIGYGYKGDYDNVDIKGKTVLMLADTKVAPNQAGDENMVGVRDRANWAMEKGAKSVLFIINKFISISSSEKPLKYDHNQGECMDYITRDVANQYLGINVDTDPIGKEVNATVEMDNTGIYRNDRAASYNVLGLIKGQDTSKTIVLSSSLDSYGTLPDGRIFRGSSCSAASVGTICSLAKYYSQNKPKYNILFTAFGNQTDFREGAQYFINNYKGINNVKADLDLYDIGEDNTTQTWASTSQAYTDLHQAVSQTNGLYLNDETKSSLDVNYPFGNNYEFSLKNIPSVFIRNGDDDDNSLEDDLSKVNNQSFNLVINRVTNLISNYNITQ